MFHKAKFWLGDAKNPRLSSDEFSVVQATPARADKRGRPVDGRFDTVMVNDGDGEYTGVAGEYKCIVLLKCMISLHCLLVGYRVAQVRAIFTLPPTARPLFQNINRPRAHFLAYVEWFLKFPAAPQANHGMYKIKRSKNALGHRLASVIPLSAIRRSVYLFPVFGPIAPREWTSGNVLEECEAFYVNPFSDRHAYHTIH